MTASRRKLFVCEQGRVRSISIQIPVGFSSQGPDYWEYDNNEENEDYGEDED